MRFPFSPKLTVNFQIWNVVALVAIFSLSSPAYGTDAAPYVGQWASVTLEGAGPAGPDPGCQIVAWTDREIKLEPIAGNPTHVRGEWVRSYQALWMGVKGDLCRFPGETKFEPNHLAVIGWTLSGSVDASSGKMRIQGTYSQCNGNVCSSFQTSQTDFQTELTIVGGELIDVDPSLQPELHQVFISKDSEAPLIDSALRGLKPLLNAVDAADFNRLYDQSTSKAKSTVTRDQLRNSMNELRSNTGTMLSRSLLQTVYATYGPNHDTHRTEFAIVINTIYYSENRSGLEYSILQREDGQWKMGYYWVGRAPSRPQ
jgi:uncharacterized protein DUF4019